MLSNRECFHSGKQVGGLDFWLSKHEGNCSCFYYLNSSEIVWNFTVVFSNNFWLLLSPFFSTHFVGFRLALQLKCFVFFYSNWWSTGEDRDSSLCFEGPYSRPLCQYFYVRKNHTIFSIMWTFPNEGTRCEFRKRWGQMWAYPPSPWLGTRRDTPSGWGRKIKMTLAVIFLGLK